MRKTTFVVALISAAFSIVDLLVFAPSIGAATRPLAEKCRGSVVVDTSDAPDSTCAGTTTSTYDCNDAADGPCGAPGDAYECHMSYNITSFSTCTGTTKICSGVCTALIPSSGDGCTPPEAVCDDTEPFRQVSSVSNRPLTCDPDTEYILKLTFHIGANIKSIKFTFKCQCGS